MSSSPVQFRYIVVLLCASATFFELATRTNINNAIVSMVTHHHSTVRVNRTTRARDVDFCPKFVNRSPIKFKSSNQQSAQKPNAATYDWSPTTQGLILGSFFYGYVVLQVPSGRIAEVLGGKWIVAIAILGSGVINLLTPFITGSIPLLTTSRVILGLIQGGVYPACFSLVVNWMPPDRRSLGFGLVNVGGNLGSVFACAITGFLSQNYGWPYSFFVIGSMAVSWTLLCWVTWIRSHPDQEEIEESTNILKGKKVPPSPVPSETSMDHLNSRSSSTSQINSITKTPRVPWMKILSNRAVISAGLSRFVGTFGYLTLQTKLPAYLEDVLHESVAENGLSNSFLFLATATTMAVSPCLSEIVISRGWLSRSTTRKVFSGTAQYGLMMCLLSVPFMGCSVNNTVALLVLGMFLYGLITGGDVIIPAEVSTNFPATIYASINMFSNFAGVLSPLLVGAILEGAETGVDLKTHWNWVFYMTAGVVAFGTTTFVLFGSSERQDFDYPEEDEKVSIDKVCTVS